MSELGVTSCLVWGILLVTGVSDAQRHRIPNQLVGILLLVVLADLCLKSNVEWVLHFKGFLVTFSVGFLIYLMRAMAGGDVKFLAVVGLWLGAETMWQATPYIIVSGGVVGFFYLALHMASTYEPILKQVKAYVVQKVTPGWKSRQPLVIPFAPAIVIGLAYYFYIH